MQRATFSIPSRRSKQAASMVTARHVLRHMGLSARQCADIETRAAALNTGPETVAIAWGLVTEDAFYAALARVLGLGFLAHRFDVDRRFVSPHAVEAGLTRDTRGRLIAAPQGVWLDRFLIERPEFKILTSPRILRDSQRAALRHEHALCAAGELGLSAPGETAHRDGSASGFTVGAWVLALVVIIFGDPLLSLPIAVPLFLVFAWTIAQRIVAVAARSTTRRPHPIETLPPAELPFYSVLVPLYREDAVIGALVEALGGFDYPPEKLEILFLVEAQDAMTRTALKRYRLPPFMRIVPCPDGVPRTKPRALNIGLHECRGEFVAIYDAEDRPEPDQLLKAAALFRTQPDDVACLQAELAIDQADDHFLTRGFALEYAMLFQMVVPSFCVFKLPVALGGTSNHFRRTVLLALHGWDAWNVTEDADLGLRLAWHGYRVAHLASRTWEEAPDTFKFWQRQRVRWIKGWMQTALVQLRRPASHWRNLNLLQKIAMLHHLIGTPVAALMTPLFAVALIMEWTGGIISLVQEGMVALGSALAVAGVMSMVALLLAAKPHLSPRAYGRALFEAPIYMLLIWGCAWLALIELVRHPFRWNKTPHGESTAVVAATAPSLRAKIARAIRATPFRRKPVPAFTHADDAPRTQTPPRL